MNLPKGQAFDFCALACAAYTTFLAGRLMVATGVERPITIETHITEPTSQPRAQGRLVVSTKAGPRGAVLRDLHQAGSAKVVFPRVAGDGLQAVTVNTAGGITGGDRFDFAFEAGENTTLTVTSQAAERAYAAQTGQVGRLTTRLKVASGGRLDWVPQETILFEAASFERRMRIDLDATASLLFAEPLVFGRAAMGETLRSIRFADRVEIWRGTEPVFMDALNLNGDCAAHLAVGAVAAGAGAMASVIYIARDARARLGALRTLLPRSAGASLLRDDILCARILAADSFVLRQSLVPVLNCLNRDTLPRAWMI